MSLADSVVSVVIVSNGFSHIATMRFENGRYDKIVSASTKFVLYQLIESYIERERL